MVRNDGTSDRKKFLGILRKGQMVINPEMQEEYALTCNEFYALFRKSYSEYIGIINPAKVISQYKEYVYYFPRRWIDAKKYQLRRRSDKVVYGPIPDFSGRFLFELHRDINYYRITQNLL